MQCEHCSFSGDLDLDQRLLFPRLPLIDQDALQLAFVRLKHEGRVAVVHYDPDGSRRLDGSLRHGGWGNQCQRKNEKARHLLDFDSQLSLFISAIVLTSQVVSLARLLNRIWRGASLST